jgi:hypothetical protein
MQLNPRQLVTQFAHILQTELFPRLKTVTGPLSPQMELLAAVVALIPLERMLSARCSSCGRLAKDRAALSIAFAAKAVLNLPTTRDLIDRLRVDETLRQLCGWLSAAATQSNPAKNLLAVTPSASTIAFSVFTVMLTRPRSSRFMCVRSSEQRSANASWEIARASLSSRTREPIRF